MKRMLMFFAAAFLLVYVAEAQTKKDDIKELIILTGTLDQYSKVVDNMMPLLLAQAGLTDGTPQMKEFTEFIKIEGKTLMQKIMDQEMIPLYDKYFTESDVKELVAFYKTPAGQKLVKAGPEMQNELVKIMMGKYLPDFQKKLADKMKEGDK